MMTQQEIDTIKEFNAMTKQAIIYTRFSPRPNAAECDSCEKQMERCGQFCNNRELGSDGEGIHVFSDEAVSGGELNRPGLQAAIEALEPGMVRVVDSSDRLARDMLGNLTIRQQGSDA